MSYGQEQLRRLNRAAEIFESVDPDSIGLQAEHDQLFISGVPKEKLSAEQLAELESLRISFGDDSWFMFT